MSIAEDNNEVRAAMETTPNRGRHILQKFTAAFLRGVLLYLVFRWIQNVFFIVKPHTRPTPPTPSKDAGNLLPNSWKFGQAAELFVYLSKNPIQVEFPEEELKLHKTGIVFGSMDKNMGAETHINVTLSGNTKEPLFAHAYLVKAGRHPDPTIGGYSEDATIYRRIELVRWMPKPAKTSKLLDLGKEEKPSSSDPDKKEYVQYWYPEVALSLVQNQDAFDRSSISPLFQKHMNLASRGQNYLPILYTNDFWHLKDRRIIIGPETRQFPLKISFYPISMFKFQLLTHFDYSFKTNEQIFGENNEFDKVKQMFFDTNPILLAITLVVSTLHTIFDILAFKNDIQFWRETSSLEGLSVKGVLVNALFQLIIFLYLMDQETSWLILVSVALGTLIEFWKITKVLHISISWSGLLPRVSVRNRASYLMSPTKKYDERATKYLGIAAAPLLVCYSIYSLVYQEHKNWYSWIVGNLVGFVYTFGTYCYKKFGLTTGFISMTPQLFINYKLKSVAHMPWKVFVYKALNTFIDDLFAFVIKMPIMHRLACFRDDIIFLVYLYQRWIYPVDKSRPNEFGQAFDDKGLHEPKDAKKQDVPELPAPMPLADNGPPRRTTRLRRPLQK